MKQAAGALAAAMQAGPHANVVELTRLLKEARLLGVLAPREVGGMGATAYAEFQLMREVSRIDPDLGWLYLNLAGAIARLAAVCPPEVAKALFTGGMPVIAMHADTDGGTYSKDGDGILVRGKWRFATGIDQSDWVVILGRADASLPEFADSPVACMLKLGQVELIHDYRPIGLRYTSTHAYGVSARLKREEVWPYHHLRPVRGGPGFAVGRAAIKHVAFGVGIAEASLGDPAVNLKRTSADRDSWIGRHIGVSACAALGENLTKRLDQAFEHDPAEAPKLMDQIRGTARYAMLLAQKTTVEMLNRYGTAMDADSPMARRATAIITAIQHQTVRKGYDVYLRGGKP